MKQPSAYFAHQDLEVDTIGKQLMLPSLLHSLSFFRTLESLYSNLLGRPYTVLLILVLLATAGQEEFVTPQSGVSCLGQDEESREVSR